VTERQSPAELFRQSLKSDAFYADELVNIYLLRPAAAAVVWILFPTSVTPNQVTVAAIVAGLAAASVYLGGTPAAVALAGLLVTVKDVLDDADGQLARAKQMYSRRGRFLDSIGDFAVDAALFAAVTAVVYRTAPTPATVLLGAASFLGITLRVSYHVYYQASFLHLEERYALNRIVEDVTEEDRRGDPVALRLQQVFVLLYGWQDRLMVRLDRWCSRGELTREGARRWYGDRAGLRCSGLLGFGTELALLTVCSLFNALPLYLLLNVFLMNGIWAGSVLYRRCVLARRVAPG
jgi:phosphatidylglycerophosphate synthase